MIKWFPKLALITLLYIVFVILWGAFVRASGSGAGCGEHWPLCNGEMLPRSPAIETIVEFGHRITSGLSLLLVACLTFFGLKQFPNKKHPARQFLWAGLFFIFGEAGVGALLVLQRLVAKDDSLARAVVIAVHLINTYFLLAAVTGVVWFAFYANQNSWRLQKVPKVFFRTTGILLLTIGATGAIVALGDTLFPAQSLAHGFSQDFDSSAHFLLRLRAVHPILATLVAIGMIVGLPFVFRDKNSSLFTQRLARGLASLVAFQVGLGVLNLVLLAPSWMQIIHLLFADAVWILFILLWCSQATLEHATNVQHG